MTTIDERVVAMKFDNRDFEQKSSASISTLDKLKQALNFKGAGDSLSQLKGGSIDVSGISKGIEDARSKFDILGGAAAVVLGNIATKAISVGTTLVNSLGVDNIGEGFSDYNAKLTSVQTVMNSTGKSLQTVSKYFDQLDTYADKTVYSMSDMTSAFAKFTNAGVGLKTSVAAIKGIGNMTALAGQGAQQASIAYYNLAQSISGGFLTRMDYKSLELANVATKSFKKQLRETAIEAGTLKKNSKGMYEITGVKGAMKSNELFIDGLAKGWAKSEVLVKTLAKYSDVTTKFGRKALAAAQDIRTIPMMMETLQAGVATSWTTTFDHILGDVKQSKKNLTKLTLAISEPLEEMAKARNKLLKDWKKNGGYDALWKGIHNIFKGLKSVIAPVSKAFATVFPPMTGKTLANITKGFEKLTKLFILDESKMEGLRKAFTFLFQIIKIGVTVLKWIGAGILLVGQFIWKLLGIVWAALGPVRQFFDELFAGGDGSENGIAKVIDWLIDLREKAMQPALDTLENLKTKLNEFGSNASANVTAAVEQVKLWAADVKATWQSVVAWVQMAWGIVTDAAKSAMDMFRGAGAAGSGFMQKVKDAWNDFVNSLGPNFQKLKEGFKNLTKDLDFNTILAGFNSGALLAIFFKVFKLFKESESKLESFKDIFKAGFKSAFEEVTGVLKAMQTDLKAGVLMKVAGAILLIAGAFFILSKVDPANLASASTAMGVTIATLAGAMLAMTWMSKMDGVVKAPIIAASLAILAGGLILMAIALKKMSELDPKAIEKGLFAIAASLLMLSIVMKGLDKQAGNAARIGVGLILLSVSMLIFAKAIGAFGTMKPEALEQGLTAVVKLLAALALFSVITGKSPALLKAAAAMFVLSIALTGLVGTVYLLGVIPFETLNQGLFYLAAMLVLLVAATRGMEGGLKGAAAIFVIALALNALVPVIIALGFVPWQNLAIGLGAIAVALILFVFAAKALDGVVAGVAGILAIAGAIYVIAQSINILAQLGLDQIMNALIGLAGGLIILSVASTALAPLLPVMFSMAGAIALFGLGVALIGGGIIALAFGLAMLGPAAQIGAAGIVVLGLAIVQLAGYALQIAAVGAALLVVGAGVLVLGAGIFVLGAGMLLLGMGLTMVAAVGAIGALALLAVAEAAKSLIWDVPALMAVGAAFAVLGAGLIIVGAGAILVGAGALLLVLSMGLLIAIGPAVVAALNDMGAAITNIAAQAGNIDSVRNALMEIANSSSLATSGASMAAVAINLLAASIAKISAAKAGKFGGMFDSLKTGAESAQTSMRTTVDSIVKTLDQLESKGRKSVNKAGKAIQGALKDMRGPAKSAGDAVGDAVLNGMVRGMSRSGKVKAAARRAAREAYEAAKDELDIDSPSKKFEFLGKMNNEGLASGMDDTRGIEESARSVADTAYSALNEALSRAGALLDNEMISSPTITPVLDLSGVESRARDLSGILGSSSVGLTSTVAAAGRIQSNLTTSQATKNDVVAGTQINLNQTNNSPKALSAIEIYRQTNNQLSLARQLIGA